MSLTAVLSARSSFKLPPKKAVKKGKGKSGEPDGPDPSEVMRKFKRHYQELCAQNNTVASKRTFASFEDYCSEEQYMTQFALSEPVGLAGVSSLAQALAVYGKCKELSLLRTGMGDDGILVLMQYTQVAEELEKLDLMDNDITPRGCGLLGRMLERAVRPNFAKLVLDHNLFGDEGVLALVEGLKMNGTLKELSLDYCHIGPVGAQALATQILTPQPTNNCKLEALSLKGNIVGPQGALALAEAIRVNGTLRSINLADNCLGDDDVLLRPLAAALMANGSLTSVALDLNVIGRRPPPPAGTELPPHPFTELLATRTQIVEFKVSERLLPADCDAIAAQLKSNQDEFAKASKKKKGGKKKKGKKKKG